MKSKEVSNLERGKSIVRNQLTNVEGLYLNYEDRFPIYNRFPYLKIRLRNGEYKRIHVEDVVDTHREVENEYEYYDCEIGFEELKRLYNVEIKMSNRMATEVIRLFSIAFDSGCLSTSDAMFYLFVYLVDKHHKQLIISNRYDSLLKYFNLGDKNE